MRKTCQYWYQKENIHTIYDFDNLITAPIHGFKNADDYYEKCSSKNFIRNIQIPTQILNAMNDPFLTTKILDKSIVTNFDYVSYQITSKGKGSQVFSDLFKNNDPIKIFKFLDEKTSVMEELSIFLSVDIKTFVKSLIKRISNLSI